MKLHRFNDDGLRCFDEFLETLRVQPNAPKPLHLLLHTSYSIQVPGGGELKEQTFKNRLAVAAYLDEILSNVTGCDVESDSGLWAWLTLYFFDWVCPADGNGNRKVRERARYIPAISDFRKYYRHLLAGPYRVYRAHRQEPQNALVLLCGPLHKPGEIVEQLVARQEIITNPNAVSLATKIYYDPKTGSFRRGAAGKANGAARRFADVLNQLDLTWDLYWTAPDVLLKKLPAEFEKFRAKASA
jgi:hypothetical protein